ncbi:MAG: hypothetical protein QOJ59_4333 [Thermomicrobiales bacterium]|jgi:hypothetical protein|nr:hypothetical protein [Thermomicrobiales bacterium]
MDRRGAALSFVFGVAHGAFLTLAETLLYPTIILTVFVAQLTDDPVRIALVPVIGTSVWLLPQILLASVQQRSRRQLPWATGASIVQTAAIVLLAYVGYRADMNDAERLRSFFLCYVVYNLAGGLASVPSRELLAKSIPRERRGILFLQRSLWGAVLAVGAGLAVRGLFGPEGPAFPRNFTSLFAVAAGALAAATFFQMRLREPARLVASSSSGPATGLRNAPQVIADSNFRRLMTFRVFLMASTLADPFLIVYARRELNVPLSYLGAYLIAFTAARFLSAPVWAWLENRGGHRAVLQATALARLSAPLVALVLPYLADSTLYRDRFDSDRPIFYAFAVVFAALGAALGGQARANFGYIMDIAPAELRPAYTGLANAILMVAALAPLVGARLVERYSYETLFATATLVGLAAVFVSGVLTDTHTRTRPVAHAWRLRGARS